MKLQNAEGEFWKAETRGRSEFKFEKEESGKSGLENESGKSGTEKVPKGKVP